jgi:hypothetical protein
MDNQRGAECDYWNHTMAMRRWTDLTSGEQATFIQHAAGCLHCLRLLPERTPDETTNLFMSHLLSGVSAIDIYHLLSAEARAGLRKGVEMATEVPARLLELWRDEDTTGPEFMVAADDRHEQEDFMLGMLQISVPPLLRVEGFVQHQLRGCDVILPPVCSIAVAALPDKRSLSEIHQGKQSMCKRMSDPPMTFEIARFPVTVAEYACFVSAGGTPPSWANEEWERQAERRDRAVRGIAWTDAQAYVGWLSAITGDHWRLPTPDEWELATRNAGEKPVDGQVWEWCKKLARTPAVEAGDEYENWYLRIGVYHGPALNPLSASRLGPSIGFRVVRATPEETCP